MQWMSLTELSKKMCTEDTGASYPSTLEYVRVYVCVYRVDLFLKASLRLNIHRKFHQKETIFMRKR